jgi:predicted glutamine amidotransferase
MCVIVISEKGKKINRKIFNKMWEVNSDGVGIAYYDNKNKIIKVKKGLMKEEEAFEIYQEIPQVFHIIHFRLSTSGNKIPELTHPFRIDKMDILELEYEAEGVIFHNGVVNFYNTLLFTILNKLSEEEIKKILEFPSVNDTYVVSQLVRIYGHKILKLFDTSKWAVFSIEKGEPQIYLYGNWKNWKDFKISNMNWINPMIYFYDKSYDNLKSFYYYKSYEDY